MRKIVSLLLCLVMLVSMAAIASAEAAETAVTEIVWDENEETILLQHMGEYGEGEKSFVFVASSMGECAMVMIHTDAETVGQALADLHIIAGDQSDWGLYVKTINGITADYDTDGSWWGFYVDGEMSATGVDSTEINEESIYLMNVEGKTLEEGETVILKDGKNYGLGEKVFAFQVVTGEEEVVTVSVCTDAETVGEALATLGIIAGDQSDWGLYVKTVNGITADYDTDGSWWGFYVDGEMSPTGVDSTEVVDGAVYCFAIEK